MNICSHRSLYFVIIWLYWGRVLGCSPNTKLCFRLRVEVCRNQVSSVVTMRLRTFSPSRSYQRMNSFEKLTLVTRSRSFRCLGNPRVQTFDIPSSFFFKVSCTVEVEESSSEAKLINGCRLYLHNVFYIFSIDNLP